MNKLLLFKFTLLFLITMGLSPSFRLECLLACSSVGLMQAAPASVSSCEFNSHTVCRQLCFTAVLLNPTFCYCPFYSVHLDKAETHSFCRSKAGRLLNLVILSWSCLLTAPYQLGTRIYDCLQGPGEEGE